MAPTRQEIRLLSLRTRVHSPLNQSVDFYILMHIGHIANRNMYEHYDF